MAIPRQDRGAGAQGADRDDEVGQRQDLPRTIQSPGQFFRLAPGAVIHRHVNEQIEELRQIRFRSGTNDPAQNLAPHQIATDDLGRFEAGG